MAPFKNLYGRKCRTPLYWSKTGFGPKIIKEEEMQVWIIREKLKVIHSEQKIYEDTRQQELTFEEREFVYRIVLPIKGLCKLKVKKEVVL